MGRYGRGLIGPATNLPKNHASNHKNYITSFDIEFNYFNLLLLRAKYKSNMAELILK